MDFSNLKKNIQLAVDVTKDVPELFKVKTFEITLLKLLDEDKVTISAKVTAEDASKGVALQLQDIAHRVQKLGELVHVTSSQLNDVIEFSQDGPKFIANITGSEADKQVKITRAMLLVFKEVYKREWTLGSVLWDILKEYGVSSLDNFSSNLNRFPNEFRNVGRSRARKYKLTEAGRQVAIASIKSMVSG